MWARHLSRLSAKGGRGTRGSLEEAEPSSSRARAAGSESWGTEGPSGRWAGECASPQAEEAPELDPGQGEVGTT